jgi:two-component system, cell cycle response regulator DivK
MFPGPRNIIHRSALPSGRIGSMSTILLVDDQLQLLGIHRMYLETHGYRVLTAETGEGALEVVRRQRPDLILLDHSLPGRTGADIAAELKQDAALAMIPIVMMTAHTYGAVGKRARDAGCDGFLSKPCDPKRVLEEVRRYVAA